MRDSESAGSGDSRHWRERLALSKSESRLRAVLSSLPDYTLLLDRQGNILSVVVDDTRPAVLRGISDEEVLGRSIADFVSPGAAAAAREEVQQAFDTGKRREFETDVDLPSGRVHTEISLRAVRSGRGEVDCVLAVCRDVSERKTTAQTLLERETQLANSQRIAHIGNFDVDLPSGTLRWSEETYRIFQRDPAAPPPTAQEFLDYLHPDDRQNVLDAYRAVTGETRLIDIEYRVVPPGEKARLIHGRAEVISDEAGRPSELTGTVHDITERRRTEESLHQREEELRALLASLGKTPVVLFDIDGRVLSTFGSGLDSGGVGLELSDIQNRTLAEYLSEREADRLQTFIREIIETGESRQIEEAFSLPNGTFSFAVTGTPFRNAAGATAGVLAVVQNITAFRRVEAALAESEEKFSATFHAAPWPMSITDATTGEVLDANDACVRVSSYSVDEQANISLAPDGIWSVPGLRDEVFETIRREGRLRGTEVRLKTKSGREIVSIVSAESVSLAGRSCVIWQGIDITERIEAENERRAFAEKIVETQKLESLGVLTGGIAHDFNNLLVPIQGNTELAMLNAKPGGSTSKILGEVREASQRASELTEQLLAYTGKGQFELLNLDLGELVRDTSKLLRSAVPRSSTLKINTQTPAWILADATQIRQVVMNLITNAAEALGPEGGVVQVRTGLFHADAPYLASCRFDSGLTPGPYCFVEVRDSGQGMEAETLRRVFEPFYTSKAKGRGLGLAAVIGIVRNHGGTLRVDTEPGVGTTFRVLLPAADPGSALPSKAETRGEAAVSTRTVLVVDDEEAVRKVTARMLQAGGFRVVSADSGGAALELFREKKEEISIAILDATMPEMDGPETLQALRSLQSNLPVVFISGHSEEDVTQKTAGEGALKFLKKPFTIASLKSAIREVLQE